MKRHGMFLAAIAATLCATATGNSRPAGAAINEMSPLALPMASPIDPELAAPPAFASNSEAYDRGFAKPPPPYESVRYRPRRPRYREPHRDEYRSRRSSSYTQVHAGFLDLEGEPSSGALFGLRAAAIVDPHVRVGGMIDLRHKSDRQTEVISEGPGPGGEIIVTRRELARSSSNLFPMMAFIEVSADDDMPVIPYFWAAGGYEVLFLSAESATTGEEFDGTFGGWGWQLWGGVGIPLSGRSRLIAEAFYNNSDVERDVDDPATGEVFREIVDVDGAGARFGIAWGF